MYLSSYIILDDTRKRKGVKVRSAARTEQVGQGTPRQSAPDALNVQGDGYVAECVGCGSPEGSACPPSATGNERVQAVGRSPKRLFHRNRCCPVGEFLPIRIGFSASGKANSQHHLVRAGTVKSHTIIVLERYPGHDDVGVHPASIELPIAGLDAQQHKRNRVLGVINRFVGEERLLTDGELGLVTGNH